MSEYVREFVREAETRITELNNGLLAIERSPEDGEAIERVFRAAHTLKGNCAAVGLGDAAALAHAVEDLLDAVRGDELAVTGELMDDAFDAVDELEAIVEAADADGRAPDPGPTIDRLRERLEGTQIAPPTDAEVDRLLGRFEPTEGDVDTYVVRLAVDRDPDGPRVVDALIDAFDHLGTEPPREELEAGGYGGTFDAAFRSAVEEEAIAAALEPVDAVSAFEIVTATDRPVADDPAPADTPRTDVEELSVDELLDEVSEFDDLDSLVEEVGDVDAFEEMGEAGSFDDLLGEEAVDPVDDEPAEADGRPGDEPDDGDETEEVDDASAVFAELKAEVEAVEFDELTEELDALEFEEYDEEVGMDELLGDDLAGADAGEETADADDGTLEETDVDGGPEPDGETFEEPGEAAFDGPEPDEAAFEEPGEAAFDGPELDETAFEETEATAFEETEEAAFDGSELEKAAFEEPGEAAFDGPELDETTFEETEGTEFGVDDGSLNGAFGEAEDRASTVDVDEPTSAFGPATDHDDGSGDAAFGEPGPSTFEEGHSPDVGDSGTADADGFETAEESAATDVEGPGGAGGFDVEIPDIEVPEPDDDADRRESEVQSIRVGVEQVDELLTLVEGLVTNRVRLRHAFETDAGPREIRRELDDLDDITAELQETVMDVRLVPLGTVTGRLPRVVRDVARESGTEVAFEVVGEDVEVDRSILERVGDPLVHLVRNAVDHGIEPPEEREAAGKPREGSVTVRADRSGDRVTIEVTDDGRGLDADALRSAAVSEGVLEGDDGVEDETAHELIFHPGLSTAEEVTDVSGRGVGMDVVRRTVEELEGATVVESEPGEGTTVRMDLPVTVAIEDVLFVERGGEEFGVPTKAIRDVETETAVEHVADDAVRIDGVELPVIDLADALGTAGADLDGDGMYVRVREEVRPVALYCGGIDSQREVVVKPFEGFLGDVPGIGGATIRGRGEVVTILDVRTI